MALRVVRPSQFGSLAGSSIFDRDKKNVALPLGEPLLTPEKKIEPADLTKDYFGTVPGKTVAPSPSTKLLNLQKFLGGGQVVNDPTQSGKLIRVGTEEESGREFSARDIAKIRAGRYSSTAEVEHIVPLWAGGTNSLANIQLIAPSEHKKKTKVEAVARSLYYEGELSLNEARVLSSDWKSKNVDDVSTDPNGNVSISTAREKLQEWRGAPKTGLGDWWTTVKENLTKLPQLAEAAVGVPTTVITSAIMDMFAPGNKYDSIAEGMKYGKNIMKGKAGFTSSAIGGEFLKGAIEGTTMGWVPTGPEVEHETGIMQGVATASRMAGHLAGTLASFAVLKSLTLRAAGKAGIGPLVGKEFTPLLPTASKALTPIKALVPPPIKGYIRQGAKWASETKLSKQLFTQKAFVEATGVATRTNKLGRIIGDMGLFGLHGQLSKQEHNEFGARVNRLMSDMAFGGVLGAANIPKGLITSTSAAGFGTFVLSSMMDDDPQDALLNTAIIMGLHGMGRFKNTSASREVEMNRTATQEAGNFFRRYGVEPPKDSGGRQGNQNFVEALTKVKEQINVKSIEMDGMAPDWVNNEYRKATIAIRQLYKFNMGREQKLIEEIRDLKSLFERNKRIGENPRGNRPLPDVVYDIQTAYPEISRIPKSKAKTKDGMSVTFQEREIKLTPEEIAKYQDEPTGRMQIAGTAGEKTPTEAKNIMAYSRALHKGKGIASDRVTLVLDERPETIARVKDENATMNKNFSQDLQEGKKALYDRAEDNVRVVGYIGGEPVNLGWWPREHKIGGPNNPTSINVNAQKYQYEPFDLGFNVNSLAKSMRKNGVSFVTAKIEPMMDPNTGKDLEFSIGKSRASGEPYAILNITPSDWAESVLRQRGIDARVQAETSKQMARLKAKGQKTATEQIDRLAPEQTPSKVVVASHMRELGEPLQKGDLAEFRKRATELYGNVITDDIALMIQKDPSMVTPGNLARWLEQGKNNNQLSPSGEMTYNLMGDFIERSRIDVKDRFWTTPISRAGKMKAEKKPVEAATVPGQVAPEATGVVQTATEQFKGVQQTVQAKAPVSEPVAGKEPIPSPVAAKEPVISNGGDVVPVETPKPAPKTAISPAVASVAEKVAKVTPPLPKPEGPTLHSKERALEYYKKFGKTDMGKAFAEEGRLLPNTIKDVKSEKYTLATAENDTYKIHMTAIRPITPGSRGLKIFIENKKTGKIVSEMNWQGIKEPSFNLTDKEWKGLGIEKQAKLEAEYKLANFYKDNKSFNERLRGDAFTIELAKIADTDKGVTPLKVQQPVVPKAESKERVAIAKEEAKISENIAESIKPEEKIDDPRVLNREADEVIAERMIPEPKAPGPRDFDKYVKATDKITVNDGMQRIIFDKQLKLEAEGKYQESTRLEGIKRWLTRDNLEARAKKILEESGGDANKGFERFKKGLTEEIFVKNGMEAPFTDTATSQALKHHFLRLAQSDKRKVFTIGKNKEWAVREETAVPNSSLDNDIKAYNRSTNSDIDIIYYDKGNSQTPYGLSGRKLVDHIAGEMRKNGYVPIGPSGADIKTMYGIKFDKKLVEKFNENPNKYLNEGEEVPTKNVDKFLRAFELEVMGTKNLADKDFLKRSKLFNSNQLPNAAPKRDYTQYILSNEPIGEAGVITSRLAKDTSPEAIKALKNKPTFDGKIYMSQQLINEITQANGFIGNRSGLKPTVDYKYTGKNGEPFKFIQKGDIVSYDGPWKAEFEKKIGRKLGTYDIVTFNENIKFGLKDIETIGTTEGNVYRKFKIPSDKFRFEYLDVPEANASFSLSTVGKWSNNPIVNQSLASWYKPEFDKFIEFNKRWNSAKNGEELTSALKESYNRDLNTELYGRYRRMLAHGAGRRALSRQLDTIAKKIFQEEVLGAGFAPGVHLKLTPDLGYMKDGKKVNVQPGEVVISRETWNELERPAHLLSLRYPTTHKLAMSKDRIIIAEDIGIHNLGKEQTILSYHDVYGNKYGDHDGDVIHLLRIGGKKGFPEKVADAIESERKQLGEIILPPSVEQKYGNRPPTQDNLMELAGNTILGEEAVNISSATSRVMSTLVESKMRIEVEPSDGKTNRRWKAYFGNAVHRSGSIKADGKSYEAQTVKPRWNRNTEKLNIAIQNEATDAVSSPALANRGWDNNYLLRRYFDTSDKEVLKVVREIISPTRKGDVGFQAPFSLSQKESSFSSIEEMANILKKYNSLTDAVERGGAKLTPIQELMRMLKGLEPFKIPDSALDVPSDLAGSVAVTKKFGIIKPTTAAKEFIRFAETKNREAANLGRKLAGVGPDGKTKNKDNPVLKKEVEDGKAALRYQIISRWESGSRKWSNEDIEAISYWATTSKNANSAMPYGNIPALYVFRFDELFVEKHARIYNEAREGYLPPTIGASPAEGASNISP